MKVILNLSLTKKYVLYSNKDKLGWINIKNINKYQLDNTKVLIKDNQIKINDKYLCIDSNKPTIPTTCNSMTHKSGEFTFLLLNFNKAIIKDLESNTMLGIGNYDVSSDMYEAKLTKSDIIEPFLLSVKIFDDNIYESEADANNLVHSFT